jgi:hypothetical protein
MVPTGKKLLIRALQRSLAILKQSHLVVNQEENGEGSDTFIFRNIFVHTTFMFVYRKILCAADFIALKNP